MRFVKMRKPISGGSGTIGQPDAGGPVTGGNY